jgi:hypothetical protein
MYYLVNVDLNSMAVHLTRSDWKVLRRVVYPIQWTYPSSVLTDDDILWNGSEGDGNVRSECGGDEGIDCEDRDNDTDW